MYKRHCYIPNEKIELYLLNPEKKHFFEFYSVGYTAHSCEILKRDLEKQFSMEYSCDYRESYDGSISFSVFMMLGITMKKRFRTVWQIDYTDAAPRFITAYREDE